MAIDFFTFPKQKIDKKTSSIFTKISKIKYHFFKHNQASLSFKMISKQDKFALNKIDYKGKTSMLKGIQLSLSFFY